MTRLQKKHLLLFIAFNMLFFLSFNILSYYWFSFSAANGVWYEEKLGKYLLLKSAGPKEVVFVGSSTTQGHINTHLLGQLGLTAFNFGVPGLQWQEYPYILEKALPYADKAIVISIPTKVLFEKPRCPDEGKLEDIAFFWRLGRWSCAARSLFGQPQKLLPVLSMAPFTTTREKADTSSNKEKLSSQLENEPRAINYIRGRPDNYVVVFKNGDSASFSQSRPPSRPSAPRNPKPGARDFNPDAIEFLHKVAERIRRAKKRAIFVLEPVNPAHRAHAVDRDALRERTMGVAMLIFNNEMDFPPSMWVDDTHLCRDASNRYTKTLYSQLKWLRDKRAR